MPSLPLVVTISSSPPELVTRVAVSAGYAQKSQSMSAGHQSFDAGGGVFVGAIASDPLGVYPTAAKVNVSVDYAPASGLVGFTKSVPVALDETGGHVFFDVPKQLDRQIRISFGFEIGVNEQLSLRWDQLVDGAAVLNETVVVAHIGPASAPTPADVLVKLKAHPERDNKLQIRVLGVTNLLSKPFEKFDQQFPIDAQSIVLKSAPGGTPNTIKLVATTTA